MWIFFLSLILTKFADDIASYQKSLVESPIDTSISLRPIDLVPFPAVTVDVGDSIDPLGFVRASQNMVDESYIPKYCKIDDKRE